MISSPIDENHLHKTNKIKKMSYLEISILQYLYESLIDANDSYLIMKFSLWNLYFFHTYPNKFKREHTSLISLYLSSEVKWHIVEVHSYESIDGGATASKSEARVADYYARPGGRTPAAFDWLILYI